MKQRVNTKKAARRDISYPDVASLLADLDRLEAADRTGRLTTTGNWTLGQAAWHLGDFMRQAYDGFRFHPPLPMRIFGRVLRPFALGRPFPAGIQLKGGSTELIPPERVSLEDGLALLRGQLARVEGGERFTRPSPFFGKLSHEQWVNLHLRHAELHLSFMHPEGAPG